MDIFRYTDYRNYLRDWLLAKKRENKAYSFRFLASRTGFKSAGHLNLIMSGKVNLSLKYLDAFVSVLKLRKKEAEYFQTLVLFSQAKKHEEKRRYFQKMISFQEFRAGTIDAGRYELFEKWYYVVIREIISMNRFKGDYRELARMLQPVITPEEARKAVETLSRLGLIRKNEYEEWERSESLLTTGYDVPTAAVSHFIGRTLDLAKDALHSVPRSERNISFATVSISQETFLQIQEEIRVFRRRILHLASQDENPERVYHVSFNAFPLSKIEKSKGE